MFGLDCRLTSKISNLTYFFDQKCTALKKPHQILTALIAAQHPRANNLEHESPDRYVIIPPTLIKTDQIPTHVQEV